MSTENTEDTKKAKGRPKGSKNKPKRGRPKKPKTKKANLKKDKQILSETKSKNLSETVDLAVSALLDDDKLTEAGYNTCTEKIINQEPIDHSFYYRGSKHVPVAGAQYQFTSDMIEELRKCKEDIIYFAENFFYIVSIDRGKERIRLYEAQKRVLNSFVKNRNVIVCSSRQIGKCLNDNTLLKIRCKITGEIREITAKELFELGKEAE